MELQVVNHRRAPSRIHVCMGEGRPEDSVVTIKLKPGANLLKDKFASALDKARQEIPVVQQMFERGELEVLEPVNATKKYKRGQYVKNLAELTLLDALTAVTECKDVKQLRKYLHQDARPEVQRAIFARKEDILPSVVKDDPNAEQPSV